MLPESTGEGGVDLTSEIANKAFLTQGCILAVLKRTL